MGRGGRKSKNQKFRVTKIRNLGSKLRKREPEWKWRTNLSSLWSWRSESSANRSPMVALRSSCTSLCFLAIASDVVDVAVEDKRDAVSGLLHSAFVFRGGQRRRGWRRNTSMAQRRESRRRVVVSQSVWGVWSGAVCEGGIWKNCHMFFVLVSDTGRGLARFGSQVGPTGQRAWLGGLSRVNGLNFLIRPMFFLSGWGYARRARPILPLLLANVNRTSSSLT